MMPRRASQPQLSIVIAAPSDVAALEDTLVSVLENRPDAAEIVVPPVFSKLPVTVRMPLPVLVIAPAFQNRDETVRSLVRSVPRATFNVAVTPEAYAADGGCRVMLRTAQRLEELLLLQQQPSSSTT